MNREKSIVNVLDDDGSTLIVAGRHGVTQTFHLNTDPDRTMSLHIRHLQVSKNPGNQASLPGLGNDNFESPHVASFYVQGQATIEGGTVSVIGAPANTSHSLGIGFSPLDENIYKSQQVWARESGTGARYAQVTLGFVRHQQSVCASDDWFVECELAADVLRTLAGVVLSGRLQAMTIGLALDRMYLADLAPPQDHPNWFLRPNRRDNNSDEPEMARGDVTRLCFDLTPLNRRGPVGARAEPSELENTVPAQTSPGASVL